METRIIIAYAIIALVVVAGSVVLVVWSRRRAARRLRLRGIKTHEQRSSRSSAAR